MQDPITKAPETVPVVPATPPVETPVVPVVPTPAPTAPVEKPLADLTPEELDEKLKEGWKKGTEEEPIKAPTPATPPVVTPPPAPAVPALLAGKYKTPADLEKGVLNLAKSLGWQEAAVKELIEAAKETKDFSLVEKYYKRMESAYGKMKAVPPAPSPGQPVGQPADVQAFKSQMFNAAMEEIGRSPLVAEMRKAGLEIPKTAEEFTEMKQSFPYYAIEFQRQFASNYEAIYNDGLKAQEAKAQVEPSNTQTIENDVNRIREFAKSNGIELTDADVEAVKEGALSEKWNFEDRYGAQFLREGALYRHFLVEHFPGKLDEMKKTLAAQARIEAAADLKKNASATIGGISETPIPGRSAGEKPKADLTKEADVRKISDDEINANLSRIFTGE